MLPPHVSHETLVRATVMVDRVETSYRRLGHGRSVIFLEDRVDETPGDVLAILAASARVILPDRTTISALTTQLHGDESRFARWLGGFLEGLGIIDAAIVAPFALAGELSAYTAMNPGMVDTVVLQGGGRLPHFREGIAVYQLPSNSDGRAVVEAIFPDDRARAAPA